jgi:hypothetical protein
MRVGLVSNGGVEHLAGLSDYLMDSVRVFSATPPKRSATRKVKLLSPTAVGAPVINAVAGSKVRPEGIDPATSDQA